MLKNLLGKIFNIKMLKILVNEFIIVQMALLYHVTHASYAT